MGSKKVKFIFTFIISTLFIGFVNGNECDDWFNKLNIDPKDPECEMKCSMGSVNMGNFNCPMGCPKHCNAPKEDNKPKQKKKNSDQCDESNSEKPDCCEISKNVQNKSDTENQCDLLADTIDNVVNNLSGQEDSVERSMAQLKEVFVGKNIWGSRNTGPCVVKNLNGGSGFQQDLRDEYNQIQHAMGGIWIGYKYGVLGCLAAMIDEPSPQDDKLYGRTCFLGANLNEKNLGQLSEKIRKAIGDETCQLQKK